MIKRPFYRLHELTVRWSCAPEDLLFLGGSGKARICYDVWGLAQKPSAVLTHLSESEVFARWPDLARQMRAPEVTETAPIPADYVRRIEKSLPNLIPWLVWQDSAKEWFYVQFEPAVELRFEDLCMLRTEVERLDREVFGHSQAPAPFVATAAPLPSGLDQPSAPLNLPALLPSTAADARSNPMTLEIEAAIRRIPIGSRQTVHAVFAELAKVAGVAGSCVISVSPGLVLWRKSNGEEDRMNKEALKKRLQRLADKARSTTDSAAMGTIRGR